MTDARIPLREALKQASAFHKAGKLAAAETLYRAVLTAKPDHAESIHLLGVIALQRRQHAEAIRLIERSLEIRPDNPLALNNHGIVLAETRRHREAVESFSRALALDPNHPEVLNNRGKAFIELRRAPEALADFDRVIALAPDHGEAHKLRGDALLSLKRAAEAVESYDRALALRPNFTSAHFKRGNALRQLNRQQEALESYDRALALEPGNAMAWTNRGNALRALERNAEAVESYDRALKLKPRDAKALFNRGNALRALERAEEALASYDQALAVEPNFPEALNNRGIALRSLHRDAEALESYEKALQLRPKSAETLNNRGNVLYSLGRVTEAVESYDKALAIKPDHPDIRLDASLCRLLLGDFERGWAEYEWRWRVAKFPDAKRKFSRPPWQGKEDIRGKRLLLYSEQGLGDAIQFCRYVPMVAKLGASVMLQVQPALKPLMSTLAGAGAVLARGERVPPYDYRCPLLSLPLVFGTRLQSIPSDVPYLAAPEARLGKWSDRLGPKAGPRVGLVWSGSTVHKNDHNRSIALEKLLPLALPGVTLVSLQKDVRPNDEATLRANPAIRHFGPEIEDFADTAALITLLDVVISVDTACAHAAGALGRPTWVMLPFVPDWRWLLGRNDSPWYPTVRLFRQPRLGDWDSVIAAVKESLSRLARLT